MENIKITVFDETFELFTIASEEEIRSVIDKKSNYKRIFLYPSLSCDFAMKTYGFDKTEECEYYSSVLCAAAFVIYKRGLPLSEILFETPFGNIEVFNTDGGMLSVKNPKCQVLFTSVAQFRGCELSWRDLNVGSIIRAIHTADTSAFISGALPELVVMNTSFPSAIILSSCTSGYIDVAFYSDFSKNPPSQLLLYSAAAYNERIAAGHAISQFRALKSNALFTCDYSSVTVTVKPEISI